MILIVVIPIHMDITIIVRPVINSVDFHTGIWFVVLILGQFFCGQLIMRFIVGGNILIFRIVLVYLRSEFQLSRNG